MTDPTSAAARNIAAAFNERYEQCEPFDDNWQQLSLATALRAAADQCKVEWNYHPDYPETESVVVVSDLLTIADELENLNK